MDLFGEEPTAPTPPPTSPEEPSSPIFEPEEQDGLQHPRLMKFCLAHDEILSDLKTQYEAGRIPHGIILSGSKGIGKATLAYTLTRAILKNEALIESGGHPDLLTIERAYDAGKDTYKSNVSVDDIRKVNPFLRMTASYENGWRVVIIDDADTMNRNAQNALLKILEEPPANTILILVCHRLGAMIPTIRSRTMTLNVAPLTKDHFETLLQKQGYTLGHAQLDTLYHLSEGSIGAGLGYIEQDGLDTLALILGMFENHPTWSWPDIHKLADQMGRAGRNNGYQNFAILMPWIFSQMITAKARGQAIGSAALQTPAIETLHRQSSLETLLKICENLKSHFDRVERANLDKRQAVLGAFSIISA